MGLSINDTAPDFEAGTTQGRIGDASSRCALDNLTVRNVFVISPDKKIKLIIAYPNVTGRNFDELLRVLDSLQLTTRHRVVTPANWKRGEDVMIANSVSDGETKVIFGAWKSPKPYIRIVPQPDSAGSRDESSSPPNPAPRITTRARSRRAGR